MKRIIRSLIVILFSTVIFSCGNNDEPDKSEINNKKSDSSKTLQNEEISVKTKNNIDFSKFEHYASIKTKKELTDKFGKINLKDQTASYAEGTVVKEITILSNPQNKHIIRYIWDDDFKTSSIEAYYSIVNENYKEIATQIINTENGLSTGMPLSDLREWNGADFKFSGFGWDFGGNIYANQECKITKSPISIELATTINEIPNFALGDVELNADDKKLKEVNIIVSKLEMYIDN